MILCIGCPMNGRQRSSLIAYRTLTTAYKEKDTDNIKRVKRKDMYRRIHDCNRKFEKNEMSCN